MQPHRLAEPIILRAASVALPVLNLATNCRKTDSDQPDAIQTEFRPAAMLEPGPGLGVHARRSDEGLPLLIGQRLDESRHVSAPGTCTASATGMYGSPRKWFPFSVPWYVAQLLCPVHARVQSRRPRY